MLPNINKMVACSLIASSLLIPGEALSKEADNCLHDKDNFKCVDFVKVYDSDTIIVNVPNLHPVIASKVKVSLNGITAPKSRSKDKCGKAKYYEAKKLIHNKLKNAKLINVSNVERDKKFGFLGEVEFDGKKLSELLIKEKLAVPKEKGSKKAKIDWCKV